MDFSRRQFLSGSASVITGSVLPQFVLAKEFFQNLKIPNVIDAGSGEITELIATAGVSRFLPEVETATWGFNQPFLGPVIRLQRGQTSRLQVKNRLGQPITSHWHGLHVPGNVDGGPQIIIPPGKTWSPELEIDQPASTVWYHSHMHGQTAEQVYAGLAGMMIIDDPESPTPELPLTYGEDDIPLILQDRSFNENGSFFYIKRGPSLMHGFRADTILVNGTVRPRHAVPSGIIRFRILNGSNARIYNLRFSDNREFYQIASDGGLLEQAVNKRSLKVAPAERAEILVDFTNGDNAILLNGPDLNTPMMGRGMMGRGMMSGSDPSPSPEGDRGEFEVIRFSVDKSKSGKIQNIPDKLPHDTSTEFGEPVRRRVFDLQMHVGGMGMGPRMMQGQRALRIMGINNEPFSMNKINANIKRNETELWVIRSNEMAHPFHVHGTTFQVHSQNGKKTSLAETGLKDVTLVDGTTEILIRFRKTADETTPYMYHCHILEHEDAGMMGQFTVT